MENEKPAIFSIGHSNHAIEEFLALLNSANIQALADVRSQPYSRLEHFNREFLEAELRTAGIEYLFFGRQLGARRDERECYQGDMALYNKIAKLPAFQEGLAQLRERSKVRRIAMMCAEKEPLDCHRMILVCRYLRDSELQIKHILADGKVEDNPVTEKRLVKLMGIERTLFEPNLTMENMIRRAYDERALQIGFRYANEGNPQ